MGLLGTQLRNKPAAGADNRRTGRDRDQVRRRQGALSYLHFETPGDKNGHAVFLNLLEYLAGVEPVTTPAPHDSGKTGFTDISEAMTIADSLRDSADRLISFGMKNFLWYQRNDWILQWRRGVRGVEY